MDKSKEVILYTVTWCPHCVRIIEFLDKKKVQYKNYDVDASDDRWKEALKLTGGEDIVPVIKIGSDSNYGAFNDLFAAWIENKLG